jgi:hypothetical protein
MCRATIGAVSLSARTGHSTQHFIFVTACPVHHLTPLITINQVHSPLARTGLLTSLSAVLTASLMHHITPLLPLITLTFPASYWKLDSVLLLYVMPTSVPLSQCYSLHPEDGGSKILRNNGNLLQHYTATQPPRPQPELFMEMNCTLNMLAVCLC